MQRIEVGGQRTFQSPSSEPLGEDCGDAELRSLLRTCTTTANAIRREQSNANPEVAELRHNLAKIQQVAVSLPAGDDRNELRQAVADLMKVGGSCLPHQPEEELLDASTLGGKCRT